MKVTGLICEFDPLHNGHKYIMTQAKSECDLLICVMSGSFTQRGELSFINKYARAKSAILNGADIVFELPFPYSCSSADFFGSAGVRILSSVGIDKLVFGSESGDCELLMRAATVSDDPTFRREYNELLDKGFGSAEGYFSLIEKRLGCKLCSNDILGTSYIKAINATGKAISVEPVKRLGDSFSSVAVGKSEFASATAIRSAILSGMDVNRYLPEKSLYIINEEIGNSNAPILSERLSSAILSFFRLQAPETYEGCVGMGGGVAQRIHELSRTSTTLSELLDKLSNKRITLSSIRRAIFYAMTGTVKDDLAAVPQYTTLLGASTSGCAYLSSLRKTDTEIKIITKPSDAPESRQKELSLLSDSIVSLGYPSVKAADIDLLRSPYIGK